MITSLIKPALAAPAATAEVIGADILKVVVRGKVEVVRVVCELGKMQQKADVDELSEEKRIFRGLI